MAGSVVQHTCSGQDVVNDATLAATVVNVPAVGNHLILFGNFAADVALSSVADTINTWTIRWTNTTDGIRVFLADCLVVGDMTGATITATFASSAAEKCMYVIEAAGLHQTSPYGGKSTLATVLFNGTARNVQGNTVAPGSAGDVVLGLWATADSNETAFTPAAGYTALPAATGAGYFSGTSCFAEGEYQVVTTLGARQPTATGGSSPTGYAAGAAWYRSASGPGIPSRSEMRFVHTRPR